MVQAAPTRSMEAYDYYLRGNDYVRRGFEEGYVRAALRLYERAVELDSLFAPAYALLSRMQSRMYWAYWDRSPDRLVRARRAVDKALQLDPDLRRHTIPWGPTTGWVPGLRARPAGIRDCGRGPAQPEQYLRGSGGAPHPGGRSFVERWATMRKLGNSTQRLRTLPTVMESATTACGILRAPKRSLNRAIALSPELVLSLLLEGVVVRALARKHEGGAAGHGRGPRR